jgi:CheY-like chemotaxis protein
MTVVLLSADLTIVSRVVGAAARCGLKLQTVGSALQAIEACRATSAHMLLVDLSTASLDIVELATSVKADSLEAPTILAFGPHVHEERLATARDAGCDRVLSRGQFLGQLDTLLQL